MIRRRGEGDDRDQDGRADGDDQFEADADVVDHRREPHTVEVDEHADGHHADGDEDLGGLAHVPAEQAAEIARQDEADPGHAANPSGERHHAGEPREHRAVDPTGPLVCVAGQRDLRGQVGRDHDPDDEHRAGEQQGPHEWRARGEVPRAESGEHRRGGADRREAYGERCQPCRPSGRASGCSRTARAWRPRRSPGRYLRVRAVRCRSWFLQRRWVRHRCSRGNPVRRARGSSNF